MRTIYLSTFILLFISFGLSAQTRNKADKSKLKEYRNNPVWIQMMNDPNANYNEAVIAFEEYWRGKPEPEELMEGEEEEKESRNKEEHEEREHLSKKEKEEIISYALEYKRFKYWQRKNAAYVKSDGTLMSPEEIQALIQQELQNRNR